MLTNSEKGDIDFILKAVIQWQNQRFPEYELVVFSLPKYDRKARECHIVCLAEMLRKCSDLPKES